MNWSFPTLPLLLVFISALVQAHTDVDNGMDMSMDGAMNLASGQMLPYLHFTPGDSLWFLGWVPKSNGAMGGACVGLFMLALVDRWLAAIRATAESFWGRSARIAYTNHLNAALAGSKSDDPSELSLKSSIRRSTITSTLTLRTVPPFILHHDIPRGVLYAGQAALGFSFMLAVMTYQAAFILSIVIGLGVGETLFGRYIGASAVH
ncbi:CTR copper uptake transporter [Crassisporium funariophilum]|nr:CTR copper uptake transporter [Crassisporium funariophilum]